VTQALFQVPLSTLYRGLMPLIGVNILALAIITYWADLTLVLVRLLG